MNTQQIRTLLLMLIVTASLMVYGCEPPASNNGKGNGTTSDVYDPAKDPQVNPPSLLEAAPDDKSMIASEETVYLNLSGSPNTLNPLFGSSLVDFIVMDVLYDGLFTFGADLKFTVNEETVESFEESEDHTVFTVRLRPGLKWHDGHPFTAHDVVYSWKTILDDKVPSQTHKPGTDQITECIAIS